jgi:hypothetical protein
LADVTVQSLLFVTNSSGFTAIHNENNKKNYVPIAFYLDLPSQSYQTPERCPKTMGGADATQNPASWSVSDTQREIANHRGQEY